MWCFDENLATFQFKSNFDIGPVYNTVTLNDRIYMISETENTHNIFVYDPENDSTEKLCTLFKYYPGYGDDTVVVMNNKIVFLTRYRNYLYELDISKLQ